MPALLHRAPLHAARVALRDPTHGDLTYSDLLHRAQAFAGEMLDLLVGDASGKQSLDGKPVAFLCEPGHSFVITKWAIWWAGGVAVPLCTSHPLPEMEHVVVDSGAVAIVGDQTHFGTAWELLGELIEPVHLMTVSEPAPDDRPARPRAYWRAVVRRDH